MIDIHTHILPGLDDGAEDLYESLEMAQIAVRNGVNAMVATPHCNIPGLYDNYYGAEYIEVFQKTEKMLEKEGIPLTLYAGMEVFVTSDVLKFLLKGEILTINGGRYILVEFGFEEDPNFVEYMLGKIKETGLHPIIAHPERYEFVKNNIKLVYGWRKKGYEIQVNKGSLLGRFGKGSYYAAHTLMKHGWVTAIASDAHSPYQRTPNLMDVYDALIERYHSKYLDILLEENPRRICKDQPTISFEIQPYENRK